MCAGGLLLGGCVRMVQTWNVSRSDAEICRAGQAIADSRNTAERSAAYAGRADAYSEKARYMRIMKLIADKEYSKLFDLDVQDYAQAISLNPDNAEFYYRRGKSYYFRASLDMIYAPTSVFLAPAKNDFTVAVEKDPKNAMAFDMLGLTDGSMGDWTQAIADFERETTLEPKNRFRVSDACCHRGIALMGGKKYDLAASDLNRAIQIRGTSDPCECEPYNPLLAIYLNQTREIDKAREVNALAQRSGKWIAPENLEQLKVQGVSR